MKWENLSPNLGKHCQESVRKTLLSFNVDVRLVFARDMPWVEGFVVNLARDTIRKFRKAPFDKAVNVE